MDEIERPEREGSLSGKNESNLVADSTEKWTSGGMVKLRNPSTARKVYGRS